MHLLKGIFKDKSGASAVEYCLILGLVSIAGLTILDGVSDQIKSTFDTISDVYQNVRN